ncbi:MAG: tRNA pseudouridine(38-40) synthase TruA [Deltaproteobacteria bacterium]|nr:tRNA pseudouridine(38-40) synthase TruA [Deltaproteobacteria bacterium]
MDSKILCSIEYTGEGFSGFQLQPNRLTIQGLIENSLQVFFRSKERIPINVCSRTDAGVRAKCNLIVFKPKLLDDALELDNMCRSLSFLCKNKVSFLSATLVPSDFKFKDSIRGKLYRYYIFRRSTPPTFQKCLVYHYPHHVDEDRLNSEANKLCGTHDFRAFRSRYCSSLSTVKTIYLARFVSAGNLLIFEIAGSGFLHKMVRMIVGTLIEVSKRNMSIEEILTSNYRLPFVKCLPATGLCLEGIELKDGTRFGDWDGVPRRDTLIW